jgi:release factor glutamine methyltransferase
MNEAELLFTEILDYDRLNLYQNRDLLLDKDQASLIASVLKRRVQGEPLPYILGKTEFMGLGFIVNQDVLIPRPETEILVETAINIVRSSESGVRSILDLGTGSGCIAVSLAKFLPNTTITATDISESAIEIAKQNAVINKVTIHFLHSDLFNNSELRTLNFELIVSNPPYVPTQDLAALQPEIGYEPKIALDGGKDGMDFYRRIMRGVLDHLEKEGFLVLEIGYGQLEGIRELFKKSGCLEIIKAVKDYNHIDRVIVARKIPNHKFQIPNKSQIQNPNDQNL